MSEPKMKTIPRVTILGADWNSKQWLECGVQDKMLVSVFGRVGTIVPVRIEYTPQPDTDGNDPAAWEARKIEMGLQKEGYCKVEIKRVKRKPPEPFTFTAENTSPKWVDGVARPTEFSDLKLACPCCGNKSCVVMPGDSEWPTNHKTNPARSRGEPICVECRGVLRLLPKHPLTAEMLAASEERS